MNKFFLRKMYSWPPYKIFSSGKCSQQPTSSCQTSEVGVEYEGPELDILWNVGSVELCASECESEPECKVWTYIQAALACFLKSSRVRDVISFEATSGECITQDSQVPQTTLQSLTSAGEPDYTQGSYISHTIL